MTAASSAPPPAAAATPGPAVARGDGTLVVPGAHGEVRLDEARTRWWNGRLWESTRTSTPWNASLSSDGTRWWDGVEWQPRRRVVPFPLRPVPLVAGLTLLPLVLLPLLAVGSGTYVVLALLAYYGVYGAFVASSRSLSGRLRGALVLWVPGLLILGLRTAWGRLAGGDAHPGR